MLGVRCVSEHSMFDAAAALEWFVFHSQASWPDISTSHPVSQMGRDGRQQSEKLTQALIHLNLLTRIWICAWQFSNSKAPRFPFSEQSKKNMFGFSFCRLEGSWACCWGRQFSRCAKSLTSVFLLCTLPGLRRSGKRRWMTMFPRRRFKHSTRKNFPCDPGQYFLTSLSTDSRLQQKQLCLNSVTCYQQQKHSETCLLSGRAASIRLLFEQTNPNIESFTLGPLLPIAPKKLFFTTLDKLDFENSRPASAAEW